MVDERARITDLTGKRVILLSPTSRPLGIWEVDTHGLKESFYVPGFAVGWKTMAEVLLASKGKQPSYVEWVDQLVHDTTPYSVMFAVYDALDDEPLEATLQRFRDEMFTESIKK